MQILLRYDLYGDGVICAHMPCFRQASYVLYILQAYSSVMEKLKSSSFCSQSPTGNREFKFSTLRMEGLYLYEVISIWHKSANNLGILSISSIIITSHDKLGVVIWTYTQHILRRTKQINTIGHKFCRMASNIV